jgi:AAA family ATP:ADP antiporter
MIEGLMSKITAWVDQFLKVEKSERVKLVNLSFAFFFVIGSYSILRSLKTPIFLGFVGKEYLPLSKIISMFMLFPVIVFYSKLIDKVRRYQVVVTVFSIYALICLVFALIFMHPVYGVGNTVTSPYRFIGWAFEFFMDFYQALVVSSFWSFVTSLSTPKFASKTYGIIVATSRIGGIISTLSAFVLLDLRFFSDRLSIPILTSCGGFLLAIAILFIYQIIKKVPYDDLNGYAYIHQTGLKKEHVQKKPGVFEGLRLLLAEPYVMGIFGMVCCFEMINIVFDYKMDVLVSIATNNDIYAMSKFMTFYTASFQFLGFFLAFFGTTSFLKYVGVRAGILVTPLSLAVLGIVLFIYPNLNVIFVGLVISRALNYGFNNPIREVLYIPTVKDVQFKSKAWIDSFGRTISKSSGSAINLLTAFQSLNAQMAIVFIFITSVSAAWVALGYFMGKKYVKTIENSEVIGAVDGEI